MTIAKKGLAVLMSIALAALLAIAFACVKPQQADAKTIKDTATYGFASYMGSGGYKHAKMTKFTNKKITFKGEGYRYYTTSPGSVTSLQSLKSDTYIFKINKNTKYKKVVSSATGKTKKISKKTAIGKLKKGNYIACTMNVESGIVKTLTFGV